MPGFDWSTIPRPDGTVMLYARTTEGSWAKLLLTPDQAGALAFALDDAAGRAQKMERQAFLEDAA